MWESIPLTKKGKDGVQLYMPVEAGKRLRHTKYVFFLQLPKISTPWNRGLEFQH